jgi:general secretion pathway protein C
MVAPVAFDAVLKKYFTVVVLGLVALMAYFQASGATTLLGASLGADEQALTQAPKRPVDLGAIESGSRRAPKSAEPILSRNPFDSVTGPLNAQQLEMADLPQPDRVDASNPLAAPACDGVRVSIITESTDPTWSIAALQGPGEPGPKIRRVGDKIGASEVAYIGFNPEQSSPSVWLTTNASLCQALLFRAQPAPVAAAPVAPQPTGPAPAGGPTAVPQDIASKIQKVSETEFNVDRSVVDKILENQAELMRSARIVPEQKDGKVVGIRLFGIRPETLLGTLGFQNGDRLETINGFNMSSPEKALEAYARLRTAPNLTIKVNRRGSPLTIDYRIK